MQKIFVLILLMAAGAVAGPAARAQSLPANTCGIVYSYDAGGNRTQQKFVCNNSARATNGPVGTVGQTLTDPDGQLSGLYPNPTTGQFYVRFTRALNNATIILTDMDGHVLQQRVASGNELEFDISSLAAGVYNLKILDGQHPFSYKVLKP